MSRKSSSDADFDGALATLSGVEAVCLAEPARWRDAAEAERPIAVSPRRPGTRVIGLVSLAGALAAGFLVLSNVSSPGPTGVAEAHALAVFRRPALDASHVRQATPVLTAHAAEYSQARAIPTPGGAAYAMTAADGRVCLAVPDEPGAGYGEACASEADVDARGLTVALVSGDGGTMVAVVPKGTMGAVLHHADGSTQELSAAGGTIVAHVRGERATVTFSVAGHDRTVRLFSRSRCFVAVDPPDRAALERMKAAAGLPLCKRHPTVSAGGAPIEVP